MTDSRTRYRVGVDIGGTFTDLVFLGGDGRLDRLKVPSTPDDYARAITEGVGRYLDDSRVTDAEAIEEIVHATTVATNAILERKGARTALITTEGFRDVLELRRIRIPFSYDLDWEKPPPLVERALRFEVPERIDAYGEVIVPLDASGLESIVERIRGESIESVAVCLIHSYANPVHERAVGAFLAERLDGVYVSLSFDVLPEIKEFERTSTTVVNAYVAPLIARYLGVLRARLRERGVSAPLLVMQSNGGLIPSITAARAPVTIIESGPAAGVVAAAEVAHTAGFPNVITLDMGGTTTKASIIEAGEMLRTGEYEVGSAVSVSSRLMRGSGYLLRIPVIDISEVGAGGGSIASADPAGAVRVGPRSAGAVPGPACYGQGNDAPTVTDANLALGYLNPSSLAGGALAIDTALAERAIRDVVADPCGMSLEEAAHGVHLIANSNMVRAIKSVSVERGRDPADFVLMAFGGAGPLHACGVATSLGIRTVLVPPAPGLFSAFGLLRAEVEHHTIRTVLADTANADLPDLQAVFDEMRDELLARARDEGYEPDVVKCSGYVDLRYRGQSSEITVGLASLRLSDEALRDAEATFEAEYERTYGHRGDVKAFELVNCRVVGRVVRGVAHEARWSLDERAPGTDGARRDTYFGPEAGLVSTPILSRGDLDASARPGPAVIQEYDSTILVPPGWTMRRDRHGNIVLEVAGRQARHGAQ